MPPLSTLDTLAWWSAFLPMCALLWVWDRWLERRHLERLMQRRDQSSPSS